MRRFDAMVMIGAAFLCAGLVGCPDTEVDGTGADSDVVSDTDATVNPDRPDPLNVTCTTGPRTLGACAAGVTAFIESRGGTHVPLPTPIVYEDSPPSSGNHRPNWAKWGEYDYLGPQVWLHNLEHGGIAFLYDPCAPEALIGALRVFAQSQPEDDGGPFRWVLTPFPGLPSPVAAVAWGWTWQAECVHIESLEDFVVERYRQAPEDLDWDGSYQTGWISR